MRANHNKKLMIIFWAAFALLIVYRAIIFWQHAFHGFAWDFAINRTAALGLLQGLSLYDRVALHQLAMTQTEMGARIFNGPFTSYIGLPTTAIFHLPFALLPFESSVLVYRLSATLAMLSAVLLTGFALPQEKRKTAWVAGLLCLSFWNACRESIFLGQVDAWVMLSLAATVFAVSRQKWGWAGAALSVAVLLKISPVWLLLYCVLKRQWNLLLAASGCVALGLSLSLLSLYGRDLLQFITVVLPTLGDSPLVYQNQSLAAGLARLFTDENNMRSFAIGVGLWKWVGIVVSAVLLLIGATREKSRNQCLMPSLEGISVAILCALLAGPLTWDHYLAWAMIPAMLLAVRLSHRQWVFLIVALSPLCISVFNPSVEQVAADYIWRWLTGVQIVSMSVMLGWSIAMMSKCATGR